MGGRIALLVLLLVSVPAWAQSDEDYAKYARPVIDKFTACEKPKIVMWARRGLEAPDALADRAISECHEHLDELHRTMMAPPFGLSDSAATSAIDEMLRDLRPLMLSDIAEARKA
jgi:hypothetical protein